MTEPGLRLPADVRQLLQQRGALNDVDCGIHLLDEAGSLQATEAMQHIDVVQRLGLVVLDDAGDSNPYGLITRGVAAGMVVHFSHDPEPRIAFASLAPFEQCLRALRARGDRLDEIEPLAPVHAEPDALAAVLQQLAQLADAQDVDEEESAQFLLCLYLPLLQGAHAALLAQLAAHPDFFVREALAQALARPQLVAPADVVQSLREDAHPQVRQAALRALKQRPAPRPEHP